jgi:sortase A
VGHVAGTAIPGERGNVVLAGHRDSFFSDLKNIRPGDSVRIRTLDGTFEYRVDSRQVVGAAQTGILSPTATPTLTLITCFPFHYLGPAPDRFIVRARPTVPALSKERPFR